ncbi:putative MFS transporter [Aspergillus homomorphus CBS 101889]|uniref:MFS general substrate transporter n=1 Tax=Aspergillus homomorphus (strain CBS 101889) TaxID=1450537 RepID=A0A395I5U6_ASPHC|nr:MFS general substrate transporter [Aspergillus homomorphus CBS 101889]RAL13714.1 MFS general substrate transporter [Aspergillus homomorphus CBS 101889]
MSLVQHVSAIEGADREPDPHDDSTVITAVTSEHYGSIRRKISYDFFPPPQPTIDEEVHSGTPAYKVPTAKRLAQVAVTILACWFAAGIVFGFAALKPVLIAEGVYRDLCTDEELRDNVDVCLEQDLRLNFFFTISSITANVSALPVGTILDRYGSRVCGFAGCVLLAIGCALMAYSFSEPGFDGYIAGNFFLALGGTFIFVPSFQIANAFPKYAGTIVALVTGAFDASAAVYLFYRLAYEATNQSFTPQTFFTGYLIVPVLIFIALITIMPARDYQSAHQLELRIEKAEDATRDVHDSDDDIESDSELFRIRRERAERRLKKIHKIDEVLGDRDERLEREQHEEERQATSAVWGALHGQPAHKQMLTPWFILITLTTVLQMLRMNYFIATIYAQYEYMLQSPTLAGQINSFFDVALPVGGVISTPFIGMLLDSLSVPSILGIIVVLTTVIGIFNSVPVLWTGYVTVTLFVLLRPLYYSAMSDYATKVFGFATFGRVYGTIICFSGLVNFSQYGLDALTHGPFDGNPIPINIFFAGAGFVVGTALVAFVYLAGRHMREQEQDMEEHGERQWLIREESDEDVYGSTR